MFKESAISFRQLVFISLPGVLFLMPTCKNKAYKPTEKENLVQKPNVIVIMADDLGYADVGFNGCKDIPTPNIDKIANSGIKFTNGYTTYSVSSPSRAGFITGRYPQRFGFERNPQYKPNDPAMGLTKDEITIAASLKQVGYKSGIIGKWHLGAHISNHPLNRGFDEFFGHLGGGHQYFPEKLTIEDSYKINTERESYRTWIMRNHEPVKPKKYLTDEFSDEAVNFVERNHKQPFFLFLSYNAPHTPLQATEKYLDRFPNMKNNKRKTYAAMVSAVDDGVGLLLNKLQELGIEENTIIFFLSDNGGPESKNASDNGVLREGKGSVYEGGFRVPFAMQWKGTIPSGIYDNPVSSMDIFATISSLSKSPINPDRPLDGVNLIPFLTGKNKGKPHEMIYLRKFDQKLFAVRYGNHKLVTRNQGKVRELYDLENDISESNNIATQYPNVLAKIDSIRAGWNKELIDPTFLGLIHLAGWKKNKKQR